MYGSNALYTPQLQASLQLQWLAVIMVRYPGEWWRPCMGIHISGKWFATSSDCFLGMDSSGAIRNSNVISARVATGFYLLNTTNNHVFNTILEYDAQSAFVIEEYNDNGGPSNYFPNGRVLMIKVAKYPYGITNAPISTKKVNIEERSEEDCYIISYDDEVDTNIFPRFQPSVRVIKMMENTWKHYCVDKMPPKYSSQDKFDFCLLFIKERLTCIHDVGAPIVCNNVVVGMIYRVENLNCPLNGRGWRQDKNGKEIYEKNFPHLSKKHNTSDHNMNAFLDISLYKEEFEKLLKYEGAYKKAEDVFLLGKRMDWSGAPISAEMTLATRPFPDWSRSTLVFEEWPITMETTTLPDDYYYEDDANKTENDLQLLEGEGFDLEAVNDDYLDDQSMDDIKCQYSRSDNIHHALEIWPILLINFLIFLLFHHIHFYE